MNVSAQLLHRGEDFVVTIDGTQFYGECVWSWDERPDLEAPISSSNMPKRRYPIVILVSTIRRSGIACLIPLSKRRKTVIAQAAAKALMANSSNPDVDIQLYEKK